MKILLVDDEAQVLDAWRQLLTAQGGCEVRTASNGADALQAAKDWGGPDALVTDVVMQPMDGFALRESLAAEFPAMRAVFVSGYDLSGYADRVAGAAVLAKPVDAAQLAAVLGLGGGPAVGSVLGPYFVQEFSGRRGAVSDFLAWQQAMSRHVVLHVLDSAQAADAAVLGEFLANAKAKAAVTHPYLLGVHEAGESGGHHFYSSDFVPGYSLGAYAAAGQKLDDRVLLNALRTAAEVSGHFKQHNIARRAIGPDDLILDAQMRPRLANVARAGQPEPVDEAAEVRAFADAVARVAAQGGPAATAAASLAANAAADWTAALQLAAAAKPAAAPKDAGRLSARSDKAQKLLEQSKEQQKKRLLITAGLSALLLVVAVLALFKFLGGSTRKVSTSMVKIPAGEFIYQDGQKIKLPDFWIDEHEVSIADYAEFLEYLKEHPDEAAKFDHPDQPKGKSHVPMDWADKSELTPPAWGYYRAATSKGTYKKIFPLTVDYPVFGVDWFDAYAYAKWKGRRLPTEQEWEKAGRGTDGRKFPWGNEDDPKRANTGADLKPDPKEGGELDGHRRWSRVDQPKTDVSPYGVVNMSGNVSEWTGSWAPSEDGMGDVPVIRGGNWGTKEYFITRRLAILDPLQGQDRLGFRTASDNP